MVFQKKITDQNSQQHGKNISFSTKKTLKNIKVVALMATGNLLIFLETNFQHSNFNNSDKVNFGKGILLRDQARLSFKAGDWDKSSSTRRSRLGP